jgi:hypothetical protein
MKAIKITLGFIAVLFSASAFSEYNDTTAALGGGTLVDDTTCSPLGAQVTLNRSTGVSGAIHCRSVFSDVIVGTCHSNGNVTPTSVVCGCGPDTGTPGNPVRNVNITTCPGTCDTTGAYTETVLGVPDTVLVAGRKAFGATTAGGTVNTYSLGDTGLCNATNLQGVSVFP